MKPQTSLNGASQHMDVTDWVKQHLKLSISDVSQLRAAANNELKRSDELLNRLGLLSEDSAERLYTECYGIEELPLSFEESFELPNLPAVLNENFLLDQQWLPIGSKGDVIIFASPLPTAAEAQQYLCVLNLNYQCCYVSESRFRQLLIRYRQQRQLSVNNYSESNEQSLALAEEAPTVNLVNSLILRSARLGASDLHIEPFQSGYRARARVDGIMSLLDVLPPHLQLAAISRIKILSGMDISERRKPQDGKIAFESSDVSLDIRVSALPLGEGESIVMRFLSNDSVSHDLDHIGLSSDIQEHLTRDLKRTAGVILMTGPTGSGKTTTLYALLNRLNTDQRKIITLEDPIEYGIEGINQMQVRPEIGFDFAAGLRSVVRQDPDVIMVGEIRDSETARIALQSAITGHLVFSTVHTNDAPGAYTRLRELGVDEHLINSGLIAIVAQRLVRKLCPACKAPTAHLPELLLEEAENRIRLNKAVTVFEACGCEQCNHSGYKGRIPITEYMPWDQEILALDKRADFTHQATENLRMRGFRNLYRDGIERVLDGETTLAEVIRVAG